MTQIGRFTRGKSGYSGRIHTLSLDAELALVPADHSDTENAPDYRIHFSGSDGPARRPANMSRYCSMIRPSAGRSAPTCSSRARTNPYGC
jgi:hypothetical protein